MGGSPNDQVWEIFDATIPSSPVKIGESEFHISCSDSNMNGVEDCDKNQGDGKSDAPGLINQCLLEGMSGDQTLECTPSIVPPLPACGLGAELALLLPHLMWLRARRRRLNA